MDATQHCASAARHADGAVTNIASAKDTLVEQVAQLNGILEDVKEQYSLIAGTTKDEIDQVTSHMTEVANTVGSTTAGEIADATNGLSNELETDGLAGVKIAMDKVEEAITALNGCVQEIGAVSIGLQEQKDRVDTLAAQLGA